MTAVAREFQGRPDTDRTDQQDDEHPPARRPPDQVGNLLPQQLLQSVLSGQERNRAAAGRDADDRGGSEQFRNRTRARFRTI